jgi:hypothetical protein
MGRSSAGNFEKFSQYPGALDSSASGTRLDAAAAGVLSAAHAITEAIGADGRRASDVPGTVWSGTTTATVNEVLGALRIFAGRVALESGSGSALVEIPPGVLTKTYATGGSTDAVKIIALASAGFTIDPESEWQRADVNIGGVSARILFDTTAPAGEPLKLSISCSTFPTDPARNPTHFSFIIMELEW